MDVAASFRLRLQMVGDFSLLWRNSIRSFPIEAELPLCRVSSSAHDLSEYKVSNLEVSVLDPRVVVFGHAVLVSSEPLFRRRPNLVYQVQL